MKRFKKVITLLMTALFIMSFAACSNGNGTEETNSEENQGEKQSLLLEEDDTIIEENDLSYLNDYVAPDALTDNYADYIFRLDGKLYQFPAPVSSFIDDGWTIKYDPKPINGGIIDSFKMEKNGYELEFMAKNFATGPVEHKDAMMIGVSLNSKWLDGLDFELSGGITFGMSFSDFESKPFFNQFTSGSAVLGDIQYSYNEPSNHATFTFTDDKLVAVNFAQSKLDK